MANYPINNHLYTYFWNKYRPAVLQLMVGAANGPQEYKFQVHEFKDINPKEKGGYAFTMEIFKGKSQTMGLKDNIKKWVVAQDLLIVLQKSAKAMELMETTYFRFTMDKQFVLHCTSEPAEVPEGEEGEVAAESQESEETKEEVATEETKEEVSEEVVNEEKSEEVEEATEEVVSEETEEEAKKPAAKKKKEKVS